MPTPPQDLTFQPGCFVFGFTIPGFGYFGQSRIYQQTSIFGLDNFGAAVPGLNVEDAVFSFIKGPPTPRATGPWPLTPSLCVRQQGTWGKRAIFYERMGHQVIRRYTPTDGMAKNILYPWSLKLMESSFIYSLFDDATRKRLDDDALRTRQATQGHNYFTKLYIKNDPRWLDYV